MTIAAAALLANGEGEMWGIVFVPLMVHGVFASLLSFLLLVLPTILGTRLAVRKGYSPAWLCFAVLPAAGWIVCLILWLVRPSSLWRGQIIICPKCCTPVSVFPPVSSAPPTTPL